MHSLYLPMPDFGAIYRRHRAIYLVGALPHSSYGAHQAFLFSAFGEHVIGKEVEEAMREGLEATGARITEFTVAPQVNPAGGELPYHEWFVEFEQKPTDMKRFAQVIDEALQNRICTTTTLYKEKYSNRLK